MQKFNSAEAIDAAKARWAQKLAGLTHDQIKYGLDNMGKEYVKFPPNVNEFIALCVSQDDYKPKHPSHRLWLQEQVKKADKASRDSAMNQIRKDLS